MYSKPGSAQVTSRRISGKGCLRRHLLVSDRNKNNRFAFSTAALQSLASASLPLSVQVLQSESIFQRNLLASQSTAGQKLSTVLQHMIPKRSFLQVISLACCHPYATADDRTRLLWCRFQHHMHLLKLELQVAVLLQYQRPPLQFRCVSCAAAKTKTLDPKHHKEMLTSTDATSIVHAVCRVATKKALQKLCTDNSCHLHPCIMCVQNACEMQLHFGLLARSC